MDILYFLKLALSFSSVSDHVRFANFFSSGTAFTMRDLPSHLELLRFFDGVVVPEAF